MAFTPTEETLLTEVSLDDFVVRNKAATFMMRIHTDAYADIGVFKGDMVVVERGVEPRTDSIVVIEKDDSWSLARGHSFPLASIVVRAVIRVYD